MQFWSNHSRLHNNTVSTSLLPLHQFCELQKQYSHHHIQWVNGGGGMHLIIACKVKHLLYGYFPDSWWLRRQNILYIWFNFYLGTYKKSIVMANSILYGKRRCKYTCCLMLCFSWNCSYDCGFLGYKLHSLVSNDQRFGGICYLHFQGRRHASRWFLPSRQHSVITH
jgi:hypothetical protein